MIKKIPFFAKELILTIFLIVLLGGLCVKKIHTLRIMAQTAISQESLEILEEALSVYRGDNEGKCPSSLSELLGVYLDKLPVNYTAQGIESNNVIYGSYPNSYNGKGGWIYVNQFGEENYCKIFSNAQK